jgi:hypothetical protein
VYFGKCVGEKRETPMRTKLDGAPKFQTAPNGIRGFDVEQLRMILFFDFTYHRNTE